MFGRLNEKNLLLPRHEKKKCLRIVGHQNEKKMTKMQDET